MEKEYYDAQIKYINEIRSIKHDIQAHMIVLQYYLESENYEKAKSYLEEMKRHQRQGVVMLPDTGNDLVNAILSDTLYCSNKEIEFQLKGMLPADFCMTEYDICTVFSNLFSNAREACEKLVENAALIQMEIVNEKDECHIILQNPVEWKIEMSELGLSTTKKDKSAHGFGMKNMIKTVKQYNGKIEFLVTEKSFRVEITVNMDGKR